ncbi:MULTISPECIES: ClbS/DfsB family four-helix bundle protein [Listeria]|uniref:ClbS/DfsB family four-helix bundle protein n=1 Tax=Listeria TaxID=1637 RepID=UPI000B58BA67|nr:MULTISPECIES: ClbS/DfsB family four-helix bundle protein [Listeria]
MARPTTKADLIQASNEKYQQLIHMLEEMPNEVKLAAFQLADINKKEAHWNRDKNIRDVLIHLYEWQKLLLDWVEVNLKGEKKQFLLEGYNWKTYGAMNIVFLEKHQQTAYPAALRLLQESHGQVMQLVEQFSNDDLFKKGVFTWSGGSTLGSYFVSATSSHYEWALKKIAYFKKRL